MAASSTSSSFSLAPTDFHFSSSLESSEDLAVAVERCPLCRGSTRPFFCDKCVTNGSFTHSNPQHIERYIDKKAAWDTLKRERDKILERVQCAYTRHGEVARKRTAVHSYTEKSGILKNAIDAEGDLLKTEKDQLTKLQESNSARALKTKSRRRKLGKVAEYLSHLLTKKEARSTLLQDVSRELATCRRSQVRKLVSWIFPVEQILPNRDDSLAMSTVSALKDAMETAYIKERWVYTECADLGYRVVQSTLSSTGDYTAVSILATDTARPTTPDITQLKVAQETLAGLAYLAQLTTTIACILDVNLLRKVSYSDFCGGGLTSSQLHNHIARLNYNVTHLCLAQGVPATAINPYHTAQSVLSLVSAPQLGKNVPYEVQPELFESIEELIDESDDSDDDPPNGLDLEDSLDWERVPAELPDAIPYVGEIQNTTTETSAVGSIMTSAADSVLSFWRVATSPFERR